MESWLYLHFNDIADFLRMKTPQGIYARVCNEYRFIKFHKHDVLSQILYFWTGSTQVCLSMSLKATPYQTLAIVDKERNSTHGGILISAYCACIAT